MQHEILDYYPDHSDCFSDNSELSDFQEGVDYKQGMLDGVLVDASWAVPLDGEAREHRLCVGLNFTMETEDDGPFDDYFYCSSVAGECPLSFTPVLPFFKSLFFRFKSNL